MRMNLGTAGLTLALLTSCWCSALPPKTGDHKDRAIDPRLSDEDHELDGEHNEDYDHDAFLGKEEAKEFDELTPEESKERLGKIVDKIDKNKDGFVEEEELQHWIQYVQKKYITEDTERMWKNLELEDNQLSWDSYRNRTYGYQYDPEEEEDFASMVKRDQRKFEQADKNHDGKLSKEEYTDFLHPEEAEHMQDIVVQETIEDIDKNKDGFISLDEYIGDMWPDKDTDEPEWVKTEREQFSSHRDKNGDGKMDVDEVKEWIIPPNYDHSEAEAKHLIYSADTAGAGEKSYMVTYSLKDMIRFKAFPKDGKLTKEEILNNYDVFVGSQATDFGEALNRHDEF